MVKGTPIFAPGGKPHWHGAAPNQAVTQLSMYAGDVKYLGAVSEAEYRGNTKSDPSR
jgi:hypothetical protein